MIMKMFEMFVGPEHVLGTEGGVMLEKYINILLNDKIHTCLTPLLTQSPQSYTLYDCENI